MAGSLKANNVATLAARAEAVMAENKTMSKELEEVKAKIAASKVNSLFDNAEEVSGVKIASAYFTGTTGETLRGMCDSIRDKAVNPVVAVLVGKAEDKVTMAVTVNKLAQEKGLKAGVLVKEISAIAGGKGGGKPDFAMAGLKDETKIDEALAAVKGIVEKQLLIGSGLTLSGSAEALPPLPKGEARAALGNGSASLQLLSCQMHRLSLWESCRAKLD